MCSPDRSPWLSPRPESYSSSQPTARPAPATAAATISGSEADTPRDGPAKTMAITPFSTVLTITGSIINRPPIWGDSEPDGRLPTEMTPALDRKNVVQGKGGTERD